MTDPPQNPFQHNPFGGVPFGGVPPGSPVYTAPPPHRSRANTFATLSVVFAFLFAPAGAALGHLGLAQIRRSGERGRDRALAGVVLSYVFISVTAIVVVVWAVRPSSTPSRTAAASPTPPPSTVAPSDLGALIPNLGDVKTIIGDQSLTIGRVFHEPYPAPETLDRPECGGTVEAAVPQLYDLKALLGFYQPMMATVGDSFNMIIVRPGVAAFLDGTAAQAQFTTMLSAWRRCTSGSVKVTQADREPFTLSISGPNDVGTGITTMEMATQWELIVHAIAAKANIVIDLLVAYNGNGVDRARRTVVDVANEILNKVPAG